MNDHVLRFTLKYLLQAAKAGFVEFFKLNAFYFVNNLHKKKTLTIFGLLKRTISMGKPNLAHHLITEIN